MSLKISLIVLIYISAQIPFGNGGYLFFPCKTSKVELTEDDKQKIQGETSEFIDLVSLNQIAKSWKDPRFHFCFNQEITDYNLAIMDFNRTMATYSNEFWENAKHSNHHLIVENYQHMKNISDLMEKARSETYLQTQNENFNEEKLNKTIEDIKTQILNEFFLINQIYFSIENAAKTNLENKDLKEAVNNFKAEVEKVKSKCKEFIDLIKTCMNIKT